MDDKLVTVDTILGWLKEQVEKKSIISAHTWLDAAQKLTTLIGDEHDRLFELQKNVAQAKVLHIEDGKSVAEAKLRVEGTPLYKEMQKQKARIEQIEEMIRIAKLQARMKDTEMRNQF